MPLLTSLKTSHFLRAAVEDLRVQVAFHVLGGAGIGLLFAQVLPIPVAIVLGILFSIAAILGHWYAVWSDPANR